MKILRKFKLYILGVLLIAFAFFAFRNTNAYYKIYFGIDPPKHYTINEFSIAKNEFARSVSLFGSGYQQVSRILITIDKKDSNTVYDQIPYLTGRGACQYFYGNQNNYKRITSYQPRKGWDIIREELTVYNNYATIYLTFSIDND